MATIRNLGRQSDSKFQDTEDRANEANADGGFQAVLEAFDGTEGDDESPGLTILVIGDSEEDRDAGVAQVEAEYDGNVNTHVA